MSECSEQNKPKNDKKINTYAEFTMNLLNGEQLVQQNLQLRKNITPALTRSSKNIHPQDGDATELNAFYTELRATIGQPRVERISVRSQANYEPHNGAHRIRVTRKMGKWHLYGYVRHNVQYLHPHEAVHLIEINRLELYHNRVIVSLQQAYCLLLGGVDCMAAETYFVYSTLMRSGFVAELFDEANDRRPATKNHRFDGKNRSDKEAVRCIWKCYELLESGKIAASGGKNELVRQTFESMVRIANRIRNQDGIVAEDDEEDDDAWDTNIVAPKRKPQANQRRDSTNEYRAKPLLDALMLGDTSAGMTRFRNLFDDIQMIKIAIAPNELKKTTTSTARTQPPPLRFDFDMFVASSKFRKSEPGWPDYRIIVRKSEDGPPCRRAIVQAFLRQQFRARILVVFVSGAMAMQAFGYEFSLDGNV